MVLPTTTLPLINQQKKTAQQKCEEKGGTWDGTKCILPTSSKEQDTKQSTAFPVTPAPKPESEIFKPKAPEPIQQEQPTGTDKNIQFNPDGSVDYTYKGETVRLSKEEYQTAFFRKGGKLTENVLRARELTPEAEQARAQEQAQLQGQELAGQVGRFAPEAIGPPTSLDTEEALRVAVTDAIPQTIKMAGAGFVGGGLAGVAVGSTVTAPTGAAILGAATFVASMSSSMISNFKSQRRDTTTAQQRVLDEGKQVLKDYATFAKNDPANKAKYLAQYNEVSSQIDQAYRQMKLDTMADAARFETALPNLAEFEAFYAPAGERDTLDIEMQNALLTPAPLDYEMLEMTSRRYGK